MDIALADKKDTPLLINLVDSSYAGEFLASLPKDTTRQIIFFNRNVKVQKDQRIHHQCQDGDVLQIRKGFRYKINWNNQIFECIYYTNIPFESLLLYFLTINHVINDTSYKSNFYFDGVQRNAVIPFQGVSGVLVVKFNGSSYVLFIYYRDTDSQR